MGYRVSTFFSDVKTICYVFLHTNSCFRGQEEYEVCFVINSEKYVVNPMQRLRPMSYAKAHIILVGFAIDSPDSLENVSTKVRFINCFFQSLTLYSGLRKLIHFAQMFRLF